MDRSLQHIFGLLGIVSLLLFAACGGCEDAVTATQGTGFDFEECVDDSDCIGSCAGTLCVGGGTTGFDGETCASDGDCRGTCGETNTCEGAGSGEEGEACTSDGECLGDCDTEAGVCGDEPEVPANNTNNTNNLNNTNNTNNTNNLNNIDNPYEPTGLNLCGDRPCECDDGIDNDGDGLIDGMDPECTGPYDDDEGSFATGIPGDNVDFCQDCFFDGNSGHGDDKCQYHTDCLYGGAPPGMSGSSCFDCEVSDECVQNCRPLTPNGCDCFGCCEVRTPEGDTVMITLVESCSFDQLDDEEACPRCVQTADCVNECGRCELCLGKTVADLPEDCFSNDPDPDPDSDMGGGDDPDMGGGDDSDMGGDDPNDPGDPGYTCDDGETVCNSSGDCGESEYCYLGCCLKIFL